MFHLVLVNPLWWILDLQLFERCLMRKMIDCPNDYVKEVQIMAVPKRRLSQARRDRRRANWKLTAPNLVACPQCHEPMMSHRVCPTCGYYKGSQVVSKTAE